MGRHALLLGTSVHREDRTLTPLPGVRRDVEELKAVLDADGDFDTAESHLDLTAGEMRHVVEEFYGARGPGDLALFYFSGHGLRHVDRQSVFLAATDTRAGNFHATAFDVDGILRHMLNITKASQKIVLLDCCFSGSFTARHRFTGAVRQEPRRGRYERGTYMLQSSPYDKESKAQGSDKPSLFTEAVLNGLRGEAQATSEDGWITTSDLSRYVMAEMSRRQQAPVESSEGVTEPIRLVASSQTPRQRRTVAEHRAPDDTPFDADQWRRLLSYYVACLRRSAVLEFFVDAGRYETYAAAPSGPETVLSSVEPVPLWDSARALVQSAPDKEQQLQYGYPVVALQRRGQRQVWLAPLLVCDLTVGDDGLLHPQPPRPSPALIDHYDLSAVEADELQRTVGETFVPGDLDSLGQTASRVASTFDLRPVTALDPANLTGTVRRGPFNRVQNAGFLFSAGSGSSPVARLTQDLEGIAKQPGQIAGTALAALTGDLDNSPDINVVAVSPEKVSETQEEIIRAAMSSRLTVAQGPPGTGKSQLVGALLATATAMGQSVLIGSTNNQAVDQVVDRISGTVGPGLLLRSGNKKEQAKEPELLAEILERVPKNGSSVPDERTPREELRLLAQTTERIRKDLDTWRLLERDLAALAVERDRVSGLSLPDGDAELKKLVVRTGRALDSRWTGWWHRWQLRRQGVGDREAIAELRDGAFTELCWRDTRMSLEMLPSSVEAMWGELRWEPLVEHSRQLLKAQIVQRVTAHQELLRKRADEMSGDRPRSWSQQPAMLAAVPGWAVTTQSARVLPLKPAMFDLVIIDEAAQCTIPAILPMLFRARRVLVIGDPRQLTPVVQLSPEDDRDQRARAGLGEGWMAQRRLLYEKDSAYDAFALAAGQSHLLDQHYRCHPNIIGVPNQVVYQGRLTVLTSPESLKAPADEAFRWVDVTGHFTRGVTGSGQNDTEARAVVAEVEQLCRTYPAASIGVVTPLSAHQKLLVRELRAAGLDGRVKCATVHKFQGSECDVMVISAVGASGITERTRGWLVGQTNLWNVAITRAKSQLIVVGDRSWWSGQNGLLSKLAQPPATSAPVQLDGERSVDRLIGGLRASGFTVRWDPHFAGHPVDLLVSGPGKGVAVLVDDPGGDPDGRALRRVLARLDVVDSASGDEVAVLRVPLWKCLAEPDHVVEEIRHLAAG
ncbi:AAA family ATPase [Kineosporia sp. J2-2]|uniref:AAA family ATPase n=1 Tax=Kineosporia corallincola TaxID=2835133 RepID=A0ABS5TFZ1_9ACTN|nr:AAA domain-containing protein [Kineosporia corallincola]MBT0769986.1 AAA family ATPase [Kineosporia corallincola]